MSARIQMKQQLPSITIVFWFLFASVLAFVAISFNKLIKSMISGSTAAFVITVRPSTGHAGVRVVWIGGILPSCGGRGLYYKTNINIFSILIYSYINARENWENSKLCENTPPFGRRVSTQFRVFPISTRVDITVYQHGKCFIFVK